ncbi:MAG: septum formation inhibitor Maf [Desulfobacterales bacterium]|nr:septum formation inhibitor Maf [Desulfobacterales bacterium]
MNRTEENTKIILASKSPRRRDLLRQAGISFSVIPSGLDESAIPMTSPEKYVRILAEAKAGDISEGRPDHWVIGADTIVVVDDAILGKPGSEADAREMLQRLGGRSHRVMTGYCIRREDRERFFSETIVTEVWFKELTDGEIEWYIQTGEPFGKAGSYAIQGIGVRLVTRINGSYTNVVGLPVCEVAAHLADEGLL